MTIEAFPYERLARLCRAELQVLQQLRLVLGADRALALTRWAARVGFEPGTRCAVTARLLGEAERAAILDGAAARLELLGEGGRRALLLLDGALAASVVAALLRTAPLPLCTPISAGERGLITYAAAALLQELGAPGWTVSLAEPHEPPPGALIEATVRLGNGRGGLLWLILDEKGPGAPGLPLDPPLARLAALPLRLPLEAARLRLAAAELAGLSPDDLLLFPDCPHVAAELPALLRVGAGGFPATVSGLDGKAPLLARIDERFRMGGLHMTVNEKALVAEQLELEVVVELGRARLSAAQLCSLGVGDVLTLERPLAAPVELRVGDRLVARGELVDVEGEAGVRLTQIYE